MNVVPLGDVMELVYGKSLPVKVRRPGAIPVYGSNGVVGWHDEAIVSEPTVIVGRKGSAGAVHFVTKPSFPIDTTYFIRPRPSVELDTAFAFYALKSVNLSRLRLETGVPGLNRTDVYREPFPLPPLDEQRKIVDILNRAVKIERLQKQAQERLREFIPALFIKMFGDPVDNPKGWEVKKLGILGNLDRGRSRHRPRNARELYGGPYPFVQTGDVANADGLVRNASQTYSELGLLQSRIWPRGTLCITIAANIGKTGILEFDACFPDSIVGFTPNTSIKVEYIQSALDLMQQRLEESAPMAAQRNINLRTLRELQIPVPSIIRQQRFEEIVQAAQNSTAQANAANKSAVALSVSLVFRLLESGP